MAIYFHGSFGLNRPRMARLLKDGLDHPTWKNAKLAEPQGYGAPFAQRYRSWLHKTGLTLQGSPVRLTLAGEIVREHDPLLESETTAWLMHWELVTDPERAEAWHYFFTDFREENPTFSSDDLNMALMDRLSAHSVEHFGPGSKLTPVIARKLVQCYTDPDALGPLGLLAHDGEMLRFKSPRKRGPWGSLARLKNTYR